jgi:hypothetical protein
MSVMMNRNLKQLSRAIRAQAQSKRYIRVFCDGAGTWYDANPHTPGVKQLTRAEVERLASDDDVILCVIREDG